MRFHRIVVGFDGSEASRSALDRALNLSEPGEVVMVVAVQEDLPQYAEWRVEVDEVKEKEEQFFAEVQRQAESEAKHHRREVEFHVLRGHPAQRVVQFARDEHADLLVLGRSGHSGVWGTFLGTTADKIVRHAPCSVLVVR